MADARPGGLVAGDREQDEEGGQLLTAELLAVDRGVHEGGGEVVGGTGPALVGKAVHQVGHQLPRGEEGGQRVGALGDELRIATGEDHVRLGEDHLPLARWDAHEVAHHDEGKRARHLAHEVDLAGTADPFDDLPGGGGDVVEHPVEHPRGERARHDAPQAGVPGVVHRDHRAVELVHLGRHVEDRHRARGGREHLGRLAHGDDVCVPRDGVEARSARERCDLGLLEEGHGPLPAEHGEGGFALAPRTVPERGVAQVDGGQLGRGRLGPRPQPDRRAVDHRHVPLSCSGPQARPGARYQRRCRGERGAGSRRRRLGPRPALVQVRAMAGHRSAQGRARSSWPARR